MIKTKRNLSGIYFRSKDEETGKWDNRVFEDLSEEEQIAYTEGRTHEWLVGLIKQLSNTINEIGDQLDLYKD